MFSCFATVNFDTEFRIPRDCLPEGDVDCRVVRAECDIVDKWDEWVTFQLRLLLKITIRSGDLLCSFTREVFIKETVWLDVDSWIKECDVVAAVCRCVAHRGKVHCNGTVQVAFFLKKRWPDHCRPCHHGKKHHDLCWSDDGDDWDRSGPCHEDGHRREDDCRRVSPKVQIIQCRQKPPCSSRVEIS